MARFVKCISLSAIPRARETPSELAAMVTDASATLAATAEAEFLRHKKIGAHGADIRKPVSQIACGQAL